MGHPDPLHPDESAPGDSILRAALDALPDFFFVKDPDGRYVEANAAFAGWLGIDRERIIGRTDSELRPPDPARNEQQQDQLARAEDAVARHSWWTLDAEGRRRFMHTVRAPMVAGSSGEAPDPEAPAASPPTGGGHVVGIHRDLTDADRRRNATGDASEQLIESLPAAIYWKDVDGTIAGANAAFARFVGARDAGEITGRREEDFAWRALDHAKLDEDVARTGAARRDVRRREVDRFSRRRWTECTVVPRRDPAGTVIGVIGIRRDVTSQVDTVRSAERAAASADQASRAKSAFLTRMSHAVRTPLTALLGFVELARDPELPPADRLGHLERVRDNGWQVLALVDDLLDLARIEAGRLAIRPVAFDLRTMLHEIADAARHRLAASRGTLEIVIEDDVPVQVQSDPSRVRQILVALVERAIRESDPPHLSLTLGRDGEAAGSGIRIDVCDAGAPIDAGELAARLKPIDADVDRDDLAGRGLSLAIAWAVAELLEGRIDAGPAGADERERPAGNRFVLRLPEHLSHRGIDAAPAHDRRERHLDPWQRVEDAARRGLAWFADPAAPAPPDRPDSAAPGAAAPGAAAPAVPANRPVASEPVAPEAALPAIPAAPAVTPPAPPLTRPPAGRRPSVPTPRRRADEPPAAAALAAATPPGPNPAAGRPTTSPDAEPPDCGVRVLLAEDTPDTARFLQLVLESGGHVVQVATDGRKALDAIAAAADAGRPFDLLITDVQMPELDGLEVTRRLRSSGFDRPVVALSAHASVEHRRDALEAGCDEHLGKPIRPDALLQLVDRVLEDGARRHRAA